MRQRVMIAIALACDPKILIADEPTTALDVTIQAGILDLLRDIRERLGTAIILITHNLGVVADIADRVIVMYAGRKVEEAPVHDLYARPQHPYTIGLLGAIPRPGAADEQGRLREIPGRVPSLAELPRRVRVRAPLPACRRPQPLRAAASCARSGRSTSSRASTRARTARRCEQRCAADARGRRPRQAFRLRTPHRRQRDRARGRRRLVLDRPGRVARPRRRVGQRQEHGCELRDQAARADGGYDPTEGRRHHARVPAKAAAVAPSDAHGVPGSLLVAEPEDDLRPDRRRAAARFSALRAARRSTAR